MGNWGIGSGVKRQCSGRGKRQGKDQETKEAYDLMEHSEMNSRG